MAEDGEDRNGLQMTILKSLVDFFFSKYANNDVAHLTKCRKIKPDLITLALWPITKDTDHVMNQSKFKKSRVADTKRGKTCASVSLLVLLLLPNG